MIRNVNANVSNLKNENYILAISSVSTLVFGVAVMMPGLFEIAMPGTVISSTVSCDFVCRKVRRKARKWGLFMIYVITGPTGVGKTKLSIMLAKKKNAIILNADSMQVYKELNIGTAKIKEEEKCGISHYLFDIKSINEEFNAYLYQQMGRELLNEYKDRNIIIVGGTGLYIKALLYDYTFDENENKNAKLYDFKIIGLTRDRNHLYNIINERVDYMIENGLLEEAKSLYDKNIKTRVLSAAIGYKELFEYFDKKNSLESAIQKIKQNSRHYAKRQYTFFNNQFEDIKWYNVDEISFDDIIDAI